MKFPGTCIKWDAQRANSISLIGYLLANGYQCYESFGWVLHCGLMVKARVIIVCPFECVLCLVGPCFSSMDHLRKDDI